MSFEYEYGMNDGAMVGFLVMYLLMFLFSGGLSIVTYVLRSLGVYTIAKRRELNHPWMAWVPVLDYWMLGSISDQYQYVAKGKIKNKRKWLIGLAIAMAVVYIAFWIVYIMLIAAMISGGVGNVDEMELLGSMAGPMIAMLVLCLPLMGISIAIMVIRYMALYDLYSSVDPKNNVMYLVLSILINVSEPFFIFFNRKKDLGMPPRKPRAAHIPQEPVYEQPRQEAPAATVCQPQEPAAPEIVVEPVVQAEVVEPVAEPEIAVEPVEEPVIVQEPVAEPVAEEAPDAGEMPAEPIILGAAPAEDPYEELPEEPVGADPWDEV